MDKRAIIGTLIGAGILLGGGLYAQDKVSAAAVAHRLQ